MESADRWRILDHFRRRHREVLYRPRSIAAYTLLSRVRAALIRMSKAGLKPGLRFAWWTS